MKDLEHYNFVLIIFHIIYYYRLLPLYTLSHSIDFKVLLVFFFFFNNRLDYNICMYIFLNY